MCLNFRGETGVKRLPWPIEEYLRQRFMLRTDYVSRLRYFEHDDMLHEEPVKQVRIFSPDLAKQHSVAIRRNSDLEQHPEVLVFLGYIDRRGQIYIADRRTPMSQAKVGQSRVLS